MHSEDIVRKCHQKRGRIRDPRSGIRKKFIPDPGGKKTPDPGSATLLQAIPVCTFKNRGHLEIAILIRNYLLWILI
jgi:hypothetical protein